MAATYQFSVPTMGACCVSRIQTALASAFPEACVRVCGVRKRIQFETDSAYQYAQYLRFLQAIKKQGYDPEEPWLPHWVQGLIGVATGGVVLVLSLFSAVMPLALLITMGALSAIATVFVGLHSFKRAFLALKKYFSKEEKDKTSTPFTMDTLFSLSIILSLGVSIASFFVPWLPMLFEVGLLIFGFRHIGLAVEASMVGKIQSAERFEDIAPKTVRVLKAGEWMECQLEEVPVGAWIQVAQGEVFPLDGRLVSSEAKINEKRLTGQAAPRLLRQDDPVLAGMNLVGEGPIEMEALKQKKDSYLVKIDEHIQAAFSSKMPIQEKTTKALLYFVPIVLLIALLSGLLVGFLVGLSAAFTTAIGILLAACPCTLGLVASLFAKSEVEKARRYGSIFTHPEVIDRLMLIMRVVFDLNGTLTLGKPQVTALQWCENVDIELQLRAQALFYEAEAWLFEQKQTQSLSLSGALARALMHCFKKQPSQEELHFERFAGGLSVTVGDEVWRIGNKRFMESQGVTLDKAPELAAGEQRLWMSRAERVLGHLVIKDELRPDAKETILRLKQQGKEVYICTGAEREVALAYAAELGISADHVYADCLPVPHPGHLTKLEVIKQLQGEQVQTKLGMLLRGQIGVAMVGDDDNDAPCLAESDLGIAVLHSSAGGHTKQVAQVQLSGGALKPLQYLFPIASEASKWIKGSLGASLAYNVLSIALTSGVLLAAGITVNPVIGAVLMVVQLMFLLVAAFAVHRAPIKLPELEVEQQSGSYEQMMGQGLTHKPELTPAPLLGEQAQPLKQEAAPLPPLSTSVELT